MPWRQMTNNKTISSMRLDNDKENKTYVLALDTER